jgi:transcriptional regulator with XRE-family HTH domain
MEYREIGIRIKKRRKELGLNQDELASMLECKKQNISEYELGKRDGLNLKKLEQIAYYLKTDLKYLLGYDDEDGIYISESLKEFLSDNELLNRLNIIPEEIEFLKTVRFRDNKNPDKQAYIDFLMIYRNL